MVEEMHGGTSTHVAGRRIPHTRTTVHHSTAGGRPHSYTTTSTYYTTAPGRVVYSPAAIRQRDAHRLALEYANLTGRQSTLTDTRAQTLAAMYQQEGTILQDRMTSTQDLLGTRADQLSTRATTLQGLGSFGTLQGGQITKSIIDNANAQIAQYTAVMKQAKKEGNKDLAAQAQQQIDQLQGSIQSATQTYLQAQVQNVQDTLGSLGTHLQSQASLMSSLGTLGGKQGLSLTQGIIENAKQQITQLTALLATAQKEGNATVVAQLTGQIDQLNATITDATTNYIQAEVQTVQNTLGAKSSHLQSLASVLQTLGTFGAPGSQGSLITASLIANAQDQIAQLNQDLSQAQGEGNASLAAQIQQQIDQLNGSITQYTVQLIQSQVDYFNQQSQATMSHLQNESTLAGLIAKGAQGTAATGLATTAAATAQMGVLQQTQGALQGQIAGTQGLLAAAQNAGDVTLVQQLQTQLDGLVTQLAQNTQAIQDQTVAIQQTTIDWINAMAQFSMSVFGGLYSAVQTLGSLTGGINLPLATSVTKAQGGALQAQQTGLLQQLTQDYGIDLTGLSGSGNAAGLISALAGITSNPSIMAGMTAAQQTQFEGLITSITSNVQALESNTVQLAQLNGQLQQPQQWSTSAWHMFRTAFFTGMGGLLPSISSIPHMDTGGLVTSAGLAMLHPAEVVKPFSNSMESGGDTHLHMNITSPTEVFDPVHASHVMAWNFKTNARTP
jgi:hypothetical protein